MMEILIHEAVPLADIQKAFNKEFNFLKLEFYTQQPKTSTTLKTQIHDGNRTVGECALLKTEEKLIIQKTDTVQQVENCLWNMFGLYAKVLRKSGNIWVEINLSQTLTLEKQNQMGRELS
jgi:hypothetical protein